MIYFTFQRLPTVIDAPLSLISMETDSEGELLEGLTSLLVQEYLIMAGDLNRDESLMASIRDKLKELGHQIIIT